MEKNYSIISLNESAALVSFGNGIDESVSGSVISLHRLVNHRPFHGLIESVPAYSSLAVFYNTLEVIPPNSSYKSAFDFVKEFLENTLLQLPTQMEEKMNQVIEIPVLYDGEDLTVVADLHQLTRDEVITLHTSKCYRVFMIGFLPGFPYMGTVDHRLVTPRKNSPRPSVPPGSVGIAGFQTGIYPQASPGGWQLIGRTPIKIFDKAKSAPCLFNPGDRVQFYSIERDEFEERNEY